MIKGRTVNLRRMRLNDLTFIVNWWQNQELMRYYDRLPIHSPLELSEEIRKNIGASHRLDFVIETKSVDPIGLIYLSNINLSDRHCEMHIMIGEADRKNLFPGAEAGFLLLRYAFNHLNMNKVYGRVMEFATEAERLLIAIGFSEEAILRKIVCQKGRLWDLRIYGLLYREFEAILRKPKGKRYLARSTCRELSVAPRDNVRLLEA